MKDLQHSFRNSDEYYHDPEKCEHAAQRSHKSKERSSKIATCSTETNLEESKDYEPESKTNSKIARIRFVFSGVTSLRGRLCWDLRFDDYKTTYEEKKKDETTRT
ncbi:hypothetical protein Tco_0723281 [Tanacetum coccineum]